MPKVAVKSKSRLQKKKEAAIKAMYAYRANANKPKPARKPAAEMATVPLTMRINRSVMRAEYEKVMAHIFAVHRMELRCLDKKADRDLYELNKKFTEMEKAFKPENPPNWMICPITQEVMKHPVTFAESGHSFEKSAILQHLGGNGYGSCPITRRNIDIDCMAENIGLRHAIEDWHTTRGIPME